MDPRCVRQFDRDRIVRGIARRLPGISTIPPSTAAIPSPRALRRTHAWADIYLPGAGWIAYDPANGTVNGANLIRVAVTRDTSRAFRWPAVLSTRPTDYLDMTVDVTVISEGLSRGGSA